MTLIIIIGCIALLYGIIEYSFLIPSPYGLSVLMYHKVSETVKDDLTVTVDQMDRQFDYMKKNGFHPVSFSDVISGRPLPDKPVLISFDDGYQNNVDLAVPLLKKYGFPAIFFITTAYIGKTNEWDRESDPIMDAETLKKLASSGPFEIGLHSHSHINYETSPLSKVEEDIKTSARTLTDLTVPFLPVLAYPYGKYPRKNKIMNQKFKDMLKESDIKYAFRIGSQKNSLPIRAPYDITRTNIKGSESLFIFTIKLKKGRAKLFK